MANPNLESRKNIIEVRMGGKREYVSVEQEAREEISKTITIRTIPDRAIIYVDYETGQLKRDFVLKEGVHRIRIEKDGFASRDTIFQVSSLPDSLTEYTFRLTPKFATISTNVHPVAGYVFSENPILEIGGRTVSLHPENMNSFNHDSSIQYYNLYEGNIIPLRFGTHHIKVSAPGFYPQMRDIVLDEETRHLDMDFELSPICGFLNVLDEERAADAMVYLDEEEIGKIPLVHYTIKSGTHKLRIEKPGFMTDFQECEVVVPEDDDVIVPVKMRPYSSYKITTNVPYCKIWLDGEYMGTAPLTVNLLEGEHEIICQKSGYFTERKLIQTDVSIFSHELSIVLIEAFPVEISSDRTGLGIIVSKGQGKDKVVLSDSLRTPATLNLPLSKEPYSLTLTHDTQNVYRGKFYFNNEKKNRVHVHNWERGFAFVGGDWYLLRPEPFAGTSIEKSFNRVADISLLQFEIVRGLSTSGAKAALFWEANPQEHIVYRSGASTITPDHADYKEVKVLPALSALFLNGEFRMGGALLPCLDANMLASYAWYPNMSELMSFSHISGHDIFLGAEFHSRIPVFNVSIKAGLQAFYGQANIAWPKVGRGAIVEPYAIPIEKCQFVMTVGFSLGTTKGYGKSILRVF